MTSSLAPAPATKATFAVGSRVINFGQLAKVLEVRPDGDLVVMSVGLQGDFSKWVADPAKCSEAK